MKHPEQYAVDPSMLFFQEIFKNADPDKRKATRLAAALCFQLTGPMCLKKIMKEKTDPHLQKGKNGDRDSYDW